MARGALSKLVRERAQEGRSESYRWLLTNYDELVDVVKVRGAWTGIREAAIAAGVKVSKGPPGSKTVSDPTQDALRSAWRRVEIEKAGQPSKPPVPKRSKQQPVERPVSQSRPVAPVSSLMDDDDFRLPDVKPKR
jgi:hypothetical protein